MKKGEKGEMEKWKKGGGRGEGQRRIRRGTERAKVLCLLISG
jgi:hypothetical protein